MGLRTLKEAKVRLKRQLSLITGLCDGLRAQLDTWWQQRAPSAMPTTPGAPSAAGAPSWRQVEALHTNQRSPAGLGHEPEFIWLSLKRTNNVACWYKITRSIMVIIMPFIKIGQLSQHLASMGAPVGEGLGSALYSTYFPLSFIKACCQWFDEAK